MRHLLCCLTLLLLYACRPATTLPPEGKEARPLLHYAELLQMEETDSFCRVTVRNAWKRDLTQAAYVLVAADRPLPARLPEGQVVRTPLCHAALLSAVHAALLLDLQAGPCIAAVADTAYVVSPQLRRLCRSQAASLGSSLSPDLEALRAAACDVVLASPFENAGHGVLERLDIPLIVCADYMETSPLGRAEWMRFYGRLFGKAAEADSLFAATARRYEALQSQVKQAAAPRPTVFCDLCTGTTWYQPGGASTMGHLLTDAGADYLWADRPESGSIALDLEAVYAKARLADLWLVKHGSPTDLTYESLAAGFPAARQFRAWQTHRIWQCNTLSVPFYEEVPFHPDRLLQQFVGIFHPQLKLRPAPPGQPDYYTPMSPARP